MVASLLVFTFLPDTALYICFFCLADPMTKLGQLSHMRFRYIKSLVSPTNISAAKGDTNGFEVHWVSRWEWTYGCRESNFTMLLTLFQFYNLSTCRVRSIFLGLRVRILALSKHLSLKVVTFFTNTSPSKYLLASNQYLLRYLGSGKEYSNANPLIPEPLYNTILAGFIENIFDIS